MSIGRGSWTGWETSWRRFLAAVFAACGAACVARALRLPAERAAWAPIGVGLLLYAGGTTLKLSKASLPHLRKE